MASSSAVLNFLLLCQVYDASQPVVKEFSPTGCYLANVLRFYFDRARRYGLFEPEAETPFVEQLNRLEKAGLQWRPSYEGYIVSLDDTPRKPFQVEEAKITVLTAHDFEASTEFQFGLEHPGGTTGALPDATDDTQGPAAWSTPETHEPGAGNDTTETHELPDSVAGEQGDDPSSPHGAATLEADIWIALGESAGGQVDWRPSIKGSPHLFIIGIPGQGKSWTVTRILTDLERQHVPALVLDFHGQFSDAEGPFARRVAPTVLDAAQGLPFSPFECSRDGGASDWRATAYAVAEIFGYVAGLGDMQRDVVYTAVRDAYQARGFGNAVNDDPTYPTLQEVLSRIEASERERHVSNVTARCRPLLEMDLFKPAGDSLELLTQLRRGLVIDLHNLYVETLQLAAGAFVLRKLYKDMFRWGEAERLRLAVVLDEAHRLARDVTLPKIMKEGRKFGIAIIVASQGLSDFHPDILANAGTKVIFRTNYPESRKIAGYIRARQGQDLATRIEQLGVGSAYIQTPEMPYGSVVQMYPLDSTFR